MDLFKERINFKPYEYPEVMDFIDAINHSYWLHSELTFESDVQDFKVKITPQEREVIHRTLMGISQIEVKVKNFWGNLYNYIPKPEINSVGATFSESEVRHERAYSELLEKLNLNADFKELLTVPEIKGRIAYLSKYMKPEFMAEKKNFVLSLTLFTLIVENVSLFSQFAVILSFNRFKYALKDISTVVEWTSKEELIHGQFGVWLINKIKEEDPSLFDEEFYERLVRIARKAIDAEMTMVDWIFGDSEIDFITKTSLKELVKQRLNESLVAIGCNYKFNINQEELKKLQWFTEEIYATPVTDFFYKRPTTYAKRVQSVTENDLF